MSSRPVADVFAMEPGAIQLPDDGKWWVTRTTTGVDRNGRVTVQVADGRSVIAFTGTPDTLRRLAATINAQVDGAEMNTWERGDG